jgi:hypothetical protein
MTLKIKMMVMPADRAMPGARFPADRRGRSFRLRRRTPTSWWFYDF